MLHTPLKTQSSQQSFFYYNRNAHRYATASTSSISLREIFMTHHHEWADQQTFYAQSVVLKDHLALHFKLYSRLLQSDFAGLPQDNIHLKQKISRLYCYHLIFLLHYGLCRQDNALIWHYQQDFRRKFPGHQSSFSTIITKNSLTHGLTPVYWTEWLNVANAYRRLTWFARLTLKQFFLLARDLDWLDNNGNMGGLHIDTDILDLPIAFYNALSVFIYFVRWCINIGLMIQHVCFPHSAEQILTPMERFEIEWQQRGLNIINEMLKTIMNFLANYANWLQLSPYATFFILTLLICDTLRFIYLYHKDMQMLRTHQQFLDSSADNASDTADIDPFLLKTLLLLQEEAHWRLGFTATAAILLLLSFTASLLCGITLQPLFAFFILLGSVMYMTSEKFGYWMAARQTYVQQPDSESAQIHSQQKWEIFAHSVGKHLGLSLFLIGMATIHFALALILTLIYISYECAMTMTTPQAAPSSFIQTTITDHQDLDELINTFTFRKHCSPSPSYQLRQN